MMSSQGWWKTMLSFSKDFVMILRGWCSLIKSFIKLEDLIGTNLFHKTAIYSARSNTKDGFVLHEIRRHVTVNFIPNPYFISSVYLFTIHIFVSDIISDVIYKSNVVLFWLFPGYYPTQKYQQMRRVAQEKERIVILRRWERILKSCYLARKQAHRWVNYCFLSFQVLIY